MVRGAQTFLGAYAIPQYVLSARQLMGRWSARRRSAVPFPQAAVPLLPLPMAEARRLACVTYM
jgi:hypothetical protein